MDEPQVFVDPADCGGGSVVRRGGIVCWEEASTPLRDVPFDRRAAWVTVGVGPEGGLTEEVAQVGLPAVGLGRTSLRVGTAAVVAPAEVLHRTGRRG